MEPFAKMIFGVNSRHCNIGGGGNRIVDLIQVRGELNNVSGWVKRSSSDRNIGRIKAAFPELSYYRLCRLIGRRLNRIFREMEFCLLGSYGFKDFTGGVPKKEGMRKVPSTLSGFSEGGGNFR
jgi:hypothetical protein